MTNELWWYVARSCGIVSWLLLAASVLWGLAVAARLRRRPFTPAWVLDLHRHLGGLSLVFVTLHLAGLMGDKYIHFGPAQIFVPMTSGWRPGAVAWGIAGLYLLVAVEVTSVLRRSLPRRIWRAAHMLSFPLFGASTVHLFQAGTDARLRVAEVAAGTVVAAVALATGWRLVRRRRAPARRQLIVPAGHEVMSPNTRPGDRFGVRPGDRRDQLVASAGGVHVDLDSDERAPITR